MTGLLASLLLLAAGWQAWSQPQLISAVPASGATGVPLTTAIVFTFDTPMEPALAIHATDTTPFAGGSILWSANIAPGNFQNSWNASLTVLTCTYVGNLPAGANVVWKINPANALIKLGAEEDQFPAVPASGSFTTAGASCDPDGIPDSFGSIFVAKGLAYLQNSAASPVLKPDEKPGFVALVMSPDVNAVTSANLLRPGSVTTPLQNVFGQFLHAEEFDTQLLLDQAYPPGSYTMNLNRQTPPNTSLPMTMPANSAYPPTPQIGNYAAAQTINPALAFTLTFGAFVGGTASDFISLEILDDQGREVLSAPDLCIPLALPVNATSFQIPANTLQVGRIYSGRLTFTKSFYSSTTSPANFSSVGALTKATAFTLATTGGGVVPQPQIVSPQLLPGGPFIFTVNSLTPATTYRAEVSTTLAPGSWTTVKTINIPTGSTDSVIDNNATGTGQRYYRVIKP
ncbi:MAG TPA: hypothetical protein DCY13_04840 [Verrucomicrobiales bacterium]|nr:hypothetical protein [Verrucomicrobiales bacterium]